MVEDGIGYAVAFKDLINVTGESNLCFRKFKPEIYLESTIVWKKYAVFSPAVQLFIDRLKHI